MRIYVSKRYDCANYPTKRQKHSNFFLLIFHNFIMEKILWIRG